MPKQYWSNIAPILGAIGGCTDSTQRGKTRVHNLNAIAAPTQLLHLAVLASTCTFYRHIEFTHFKLRDAHTRHDTHKRGRGKGDHNSKNTSTYSTL